MPRRRTLRDVQRETTRQRIAVAALRVFRRDGVASCHIDTIARAARVSRATFYLHYPTREHVLVEFVEGFHDALAREVEALPQELDLEHTCLAMANVVGAAWSKERELLVDCIGLSFRRAELTAPGPAQRLSTEVSRRFENAARRGELSALLPPRAAAELFLLQCMSTLGAWSISKQPATVLPAMLSATVLFFLRGALPRR